MIDLTVFKQEDGNYIWKYDGTFPEFNAKKTVDALTEWIRDFFAETGGKIAVVGISGGKDSSVVAALCARALGPENVIGVTMPNGGQKDWKDQDNLVEYLGIRKLEFDIDAITNAFRETAADACIATPGFSIEESNTVPEDMWNTPEGNYKLDEPLVDGTVEMDTQLYELPRTAAINMPARVRMTTLYMIAQSLNESARVANTCNLSEDWTGWATRYGDGAGDFSPLANLTASEVCLLGLYLGLPEHLIFKAPADGLTDKTDEDNFGFTYEELDLYIRIGGHASIPEETMHKINAMHARNKFKMFMPPTFKSGQPILAPDLDVCDLEQNEPDDVATADLAEHMDDVDTTESVDAAAEYEFTKSGEILRNLASSRRKKVFIKSEKPAELPKDYIDAVPSDGHDYKDDMNPCPNCHTNEHLRIKEDLVSLNALEYWVRCDGCDREWTDRMLGVSYAETPEELIELWNGQTPGCESPGVPKDNPF